MQSGLHDGMACLGKQVFVTCKFLNLKEILILMEILKDDFEGKFWSFAGSQ